MRSTPVRSRLMLRKLAPDYNPHDRLGAMNYVQERSAAGEIVTGLLFIDNDAEDLHANHGITETPLNVLNEKELCPGSATLAKINASFQ